jgi:hypothetical protein
MATHISIIFSNLLNKRNEINFKNYLIYSNYLAYVKCLMGFNQTNTSTKKH